MLTASLATGFAAAVRPVAAQTVIHTDSEGIEAGRGEHPRRRPRHSRLPRHAGDVRYIPGHPGRAGDLRRARAHQGCVPAPRQARLLGHRARALRAPGRRRRRSPTSKEIIAKVVSKVPDAQVMSDLDATVAWAKASGKATPPSSASPASAGAGASSGFTRRTARSSRPAWPGTAARRRRRPRLTPRHPIDVAAELKAPVLGLYGGADQGIPVETIDRMRAACKAAGKQCEIVVYPDTPHAFNADYRPSYRPEAAKDGVGAHARLVPRPRRHLSGPQSFRHNRRLDIPTAHKGLPAWPCN